MTLRRQAVLLLLFCGLLYLPGAATPLFTRGEAREALAVREVVQSGAWVVPMRPDGQLTRKPPLFYWSGMLVWNVLPGRPEAAVRLPSIVAGAAAVAAVAWLGGAAAGPSAPLAALMLATSFEWLRAATSARVDMVLVAAMTLVLLGTVVRLDGRAARWPFAAMAVGTALAVLAKGPIGGAFPALALAVTAAVARDARLLRLLVPLGLGAALAALWYAVAWLAHGQRFLDVVLAENLGRFVDTDQARTGHAHGALYLVLVGVVGFLPWTPLLPLAAARGGARPLVRTFLLAWIAVVVLVVLASTSKRSVYLLPAFPALVLLVAAGAGAALSPRLARIVRTATALYAPAFGVAAVALALVALGVPVARLLADVLAPEDHLAFAALEGSPDVRLALGASAIAAFAAAVALARARAAAAWRRAIVLTAGTIALLVVAMQVEIRPAVARARGFAEFLPALAPLLPPDEPLYAYLPVDPGVRFYAPRPIASWRERPADRDVHLVAWEREIAAFPPAAQQALVRLATSEARRGRRGRLVLVRVPRGVLPPRRAAAAQNG